MVSAAQFSAPQYCFISCTDCSDRHSRMLRLNPASKHLLHCGHWLVRAAGHVGVWVLQLSVKPVKTVKNWRENTRKWTAIMMVFVGGGRYGHQLS